MTISFVSAISLTAGWWGTVHPIKWKAKFGGMDASEAKRVKDENAMLKNRLAERMLDVAALPELLGKMCRPPRPCKGWRYHK
jgi:putative transposase